MKLLRVQRGCDGCKQNQSREPATIDGFMPKAQESIMGQQTQRNRCWVLSLRPHGAPVPYVWFR